VYKGIIEKQVNYCALFRHEVNIDEELENGLLKCRLTLEVHTEYVSYNSV